MKPRYFYPNTICLFTEEKYICENDENIDYDTSNKLLDYGLFSKVKFVFSLHPFQQPRSNWKQVLIFVICVSQNYTEMTAGDQIQQSGSYVDHRINS